MEPKSFRPLAGIMVLIGSGLFFGCWFRGDVSVPLRGLWFLSGEKKKKIKKSTPKKFPSPCGDYGSYRLRRFTIMTNDKKKSFRPLAGIMVLICWLYHVQRRHGASFRPLAGIMVLIMIMTNTWRQRSNSFRPLAGIMVLIP